MFAAGFDVARGEHACPLDRHLASLAEAKGVGALGDLLQPRRHVELGVAFIDARAHAAEAEHAHEKHDHHHHHEREGEQVGVVEREHGQAHDRGHHDRHAIDEQRGDRLLHGGDLEKSVHDVGGIAAVERLDLGAGEAGGEGVGGAGEDPPLHVFSDDHLHRPQEGGEDQEGQHHEREHDHRPEQHAEGHGVDEGLDGGRRHDREQTHAEGEGQDHGHIAPFEAQQLHQPCPRPNYGAAMMPCSFCHTVQRPTMMKPAAETHNSKSHGFEGVSRGSIAR